MQELTILQMNDTHGYLQSHPEMFIENGQEAYRDAGGFARIATLIEREREANTNNVLVFDNGDTFHGTYPVIATKGKGMLPILNTIGFDAMTAHWEFAYGPEQLQSLVEQLDYPMLACNCYAEATNDRLFPSHMIVERAGLSIGVIGLAEHIVDKTMPTHFSEGVYFTLGVDEVRELTHTLKEENDVDLVILLSHFGFPQEVQLAQEVDGIDVLLSSHTHNALTKPAIVNDTIMMQSGCHGAHIGKLNITITKNKIVSFEHELIEVSPDISPNEKIENMITKLRAPYEHMLQEEIGIVRTPLHRYSQLETRMDNFLLRALLHATKAQVVFSNGWRYGAPIQAGTLTMEDLWNIIPTNPPVSTVSLSGEEIWNMLEENLESTFSRNPYEQMGGNVKRCLGLKMYVKIENPKGLRIQHLFIGKEKVNMDKLYDVAFVTVQGVPSKYGRNRKNLQIHAIDALRQYVDVEKTIDTPLEGTIQVI